MPKQQKNTLSIGLREISNMDSLTSVISWSVIMLCTFFSAMFADIAHFPKPVVITIGLTTFLVVTLSVASFFGIRKMRADERSIDRTPKLSLLEIREKAISQGWDFSEGSEQSLEFTLAISQAGLDCVIQYWGVKQEDLSSPSSDGELVEIPASHWLNFAVEPVRFVTSESNQHVRSYEFPSLTKKGYINLYVNRDQAMKWLNTTTETSRNLNLKDLNSA